MNDRQLRSGWTAAKWSLLAICVAAAAAVPARAEAVKVEALRQKQQQQQRARELARDLVSGILDVQLQQLEENGLTDRRIYREVRNMRQNIDGLVEAEMLAVVELLLKAQQGDRVQREELFVQSRRMIRQVVIRLAIERRNLLRRLKTAELAAQTKRLIGIQTVVLNVTQQIPEQSKSRQEAQALKTIEDQRDVKQLFLHLVESLSDVRQWGGAVGTGAADGLRILKAAGVGEALDAAGENLRGAEFASAADNQRDVIKGLRQLLEKLEETQGLIGTDRETLLEMVRELTRQQEELRNKTRQTDLGQPEAEQLVEQQAAVHKQLGKLADSLSEFPNTEPLVEQAKAAAYEATGRLFDAKREEALTEQAKVLGGLAEIEQRLQEASDIDNADKTAEEYAQQVRDLEATREELREAEQQQQQANQAAKTEPAKAQPAEEKVAAIAEKAMERKLPPAVKSRLAETAAAAREAADKAPDAAEPKEARQQAIEKTDEALARAVSEVEAALADAKRRAPGVKIGELARAAEALERAAAAERRIAREADEAAKKQGLMKPAADALAEEHKEVEEVARKIAEGVKNTAPEAAETLKRAEEDARKVTGLIKRAQEQPGEPSKPTAQQTARQAEATAQQLTPRRPATAPRDQADGRRTGRGQRAAIGPSFRRPGRRRRRAGRASRKRRGTHAATRGGGRESPAGQGATATRRRPPRSGRSQRSGGTHRQGAAAAGGRRPRGRGRRQRQGEHPAGRHRQAAGGFQPGRRVGRGRRQAAAGGSLPFAGQAGRIGRGAQRGAARRRRGGQGLARRRSVKGRRRPRAGPQAARPGQTDGG